MPTSSGRQVRQSAVGQYSPWYAPVAMKWSKVAGVEETEPPLPQPTQAKVGRTAPAATTRNPRRLMPAPSVRAHADREDLARAAAHEDLHRPAADRAVLEVALLVPTGRVDVEGEGLPAARAVDDDLLHHGPVSHPCCFVNALTK